MSHIINHSYPSENLDFHLQLEKLSNASFLCVNKKSGFLYNTSFVHFLFEKIKGTFHFCDWSSKRLIELKFMQFLKNNKDLISIENDFPLIQKLAKRLGLFEDNIQSVSKHSQLECLLQYIRKEKEQKEHLSDSDYQLLIDNFTIHYSKKLQSFNPSILENRTSSIALKNLSIQTPIKESNPSAISKEEKANTTIPLHTFNDPSKSLKISPILTFKELLQTLKEDVQSIKKTNTSFLIDHYYARLCENTEADSLLDKWIKDKFLSVSEGITEEEIQDTKKLLDLKTLIRDFGKQNALALLSSGFQLAYHFSFLGTKEEQAASKLATSLFENALQDLFPRLGSSKNMDIKTLKFEKKSVHPSFLQSLEPFDIFKNYGKIGVLALSTLTLFGLSYYLLSPSNASSLSCVSGTSSQAAVKEAPPPTPPFEPPKDEKEKNLEHKTKTAPFSILPSKLISKPLQVFSSDPLLITAPPKNVVNKHFVDLEKNKNADSYSPFSHLTDKIMMLCLGIFGTYFTMSAFSNSSSDNLSTSSPLTMKLLPTSPLPSSKNPDSSLSILSKEKADELAKKLTTLKLSSELINVIQENKELSYLAYQDLTTQPLMPKEDSAPIGIKNSGNSCYRSCVYQLLFSCVPLLKDHFLHSLEKTVLKDNLIMSIALKQFLSNYVQAQQAAKTLSGDLSLCKKWDSTDLLPSLKENHGTQQDAHEYLTAIFSIFNLGVYSHEKVIWEKELDAPSLDDHNEPLVHQGPTEYSPIFSGAITQQDKSLQEIFDHYFQGEKVDEKNNPPIDPSKSNARNIEHLGETYHVKKYTANPVLIENPNFITFHIKRIISSELNIIVKKIVNGKEIEKLEKITHYTYIDSSLKANDQIDLSKAFLENSESANYDIQGFINFELASFNTETGKTSGHYTACVKKGTKWYNCNDACVTELSIEQMQKKRSEAITFLLKRQDVEEKKEDLTEIRD